YRGQTREYLMPSRMEFFTEKIIPYGDVRDSSLVPSIYRLIDQHCKTTNSYSAMLDEIEWWRSLAGSAIPVPFKTRKSQEKPIDPAPHLPDLGLSVRTVTRDKSSDQIVSDETHDYNFVLNELQRQLVLQHYGAPTP